MSIFRGSKRLLVGLGLAGCSATAAVLFGLHNDTIYSVKAATLLPDSLSSQFMPGNNRAQSPSGMTWDYNWDMRAPNLSKGKFGEYASPKSDGDQTLEQAKAVASRHLILVRHGQYNMSGKSDEERYLTALGREQAKLAGVRLRDMGITFDRMVQSTMTRATETAQIIAKELAPDLKVESCDFLREGAPIQPEPSNPSRTYRPSAPTIFKDGARIEAAFRRYFYRADPSQQKDSYELLVCHANVIRYFICRALQFPPEAWLRFGLHNCSLTWIVIRPSGNVAVYFIGDSGHIPPSKMTSG